MMKLNLYSIRLNPETKAKVDEEAKKKDWSFSQFVRNLIEKTVGK